MCKSKCRYSYCGECLLTNSIVPQDALCYIGQQEIQNRFRGETHVLKKMDRTILNVIGNNANYCLQ